MRTCMVLMHTKECVFVCNISLYATLIYSISKTLYRRDKESPRHIKKELDIFIQHTSTRKRLGIKNNWILKKSIQCLSEAVIACTSSSQFVIISSQIVFSQINLKLNTRVYYSLEKIIQITFTMFLLTVNFMLLLCVDKTVWTLCWTWHSISGLSCAYDGSGSVTLKEINHLAFIRRWIVDKVSLLH